MKIIQHITTKYHHAYTGWNKIEFTDQAGNEVNVEMTDEDYLELEGIITNKCDRIRKEREEKARELAAESEGDQSDE